MMTVGKKKMNTILKSSQKSKYFGTKWSAKVDQQWVLPVIFIIPSPVAKFFKENFKTCRLDYQPLLKTCGFLKVGNTGYFSNGMGEKLIKFFGE